MPQPSSRVKHWLGPIAHTPQTQAGSFKPSHQEMLPTLLIWLKKKEEETLHYHSTFCTAVSSDRAYSRSQSPTEDLLRWFYPESQELIMSNSEGLLADLEYTSEITVLISVSIPVHWTSLGTILQQGLLDDGWYAQIKEKHHYFTLKPYWTNPQRIYGSGQYCLDLLEAEIQPTASTSSLSHSKTF